MCTAGTECSLDSSTCVDIPKKGEPCSPATQGCAGVGVYCKPTGASSGICTDAAGLGDRCAYAIDPMNTISIPCAMGYCDTMSTLTCRPSFKQLGNKCASDGECISDRCAVQQDQTLACAMACN
jgi:hypothetical protein